MQIGLKLSNKNFNAMMQRYTNEEGSIEFEDFLVCVARLRNALRMQHRLLFHSFISSNMTILR